MSQVWPPLPSPVVTLEGIVDTPASGSIDVVFERPFAAEPVIQCTARRLTVARVVVSMSGTSETGFNISTWSNASDTQIAGRVNWSARGILA